MTGYDTLIASDLPKTEVQVIQVSEGLHSNGKIDTAPLDPLGRVAGPRYADIGPVASYRAMQHTLFTEREGA